MVDITDPSIVESWKVLTDQKGETNWVTWQLNGNKLEVVENGTGGLKELKAKLAEGGETKILFGGLKVIGVDNRENVTSRRQKIVAWTWIGTKVPVLKKASVSIQRQQVQAAMKGMTMAFDITDLDHFEEGELSKSLLKAGAAHKPTHYDFGPDQLVALD